nr:hypothetical protein [Gammaproteobacteria bacterium]
MITLGPYVIFSGSKATKWSYFKFDPNNPEQPASYYTAPYAETNTEIKWTQSPLANKTPIYLYDIAENTPRCYVMDTGILYDVPLQSLNGKPLVNAMRQITLKNHEITHQMARKRAREYGVTTNQYPHPGNFSTNIPALPITEPVIATAEVSHPSVSSGGAKKTLEVTQCIQVETEADCPTEIAKGCMYVWKKGDQWSFKTNFLESIKTGIFDTQLDKDVITTLNTQPLGD